MPTKCFRKAFTLVELIVVVSIFSLLFVGSLLSTQAIQNSTTDYGISYAVNSTTRITLENILNYASQAVGSTNYAGGDLGIVIGSAQMTDPHNYSFCIHLRSSSGADTWRCYSLISNNIYYCTENYGPPRTTPSACTPPPGNGIFLGTAVSWQTPASATCLSTDSSTGSWPNALLPGFCSNTATGNQSLLFSISITNRLNPAVASASGTNPQVIVSGSVSPSGHAMW